jgi:hypothetical protein
MTSIWEKQAFFPFSLSTLLHDTPLQHTQNEDVALFAALFHGQNVKFQKTRIRLFSSIFLFFSWLSFRFSSQ